MNFDAKTFLKHISERSGIYQMRDKNGVLLYVGKAKNLQKRLSSYFRADLTPKTRALMEKVVDIDTTIVNNEIEALILENNLIKTHQPKFNILLRDDKTYPYLYFSTHNFPRLSLERKRQIAKNQRTNFLGPYPNVSVAQNALLSLQKIFQLRSCADTEFSNRSRPCLQYQIKRCSAPCVSLISQKHYLENIQSARDFLEGKSDILLKNLELKMQSASEAQNYEEAANYRDRIRDLRALTASQYIDNAINDSDILAVKKDYGRACVQVLFFRNGKNIASKPYYLKNPTDEDLKELLTAFIGQFYLNHFIPQNLILSENLENIDELEEFLSHKAEKKIKIKQRLSLEEKQLLKIALENAESNLKLELSAKKNMALRFKDLALKFNLKQIPKRIECSDISHFMGEATYGSLVVFEPEGAKKADYRLYKIENIPAGDDLAAQSQLIERHFTKLQEEQNIFKLPDIFLIDGGEEQLKAGIEVFNKLKIKNVLLMAIVKGEGRKRGLEQFYLYNPQDNQLSEKIQIEPNSEAMQLLIQIRDEAHRFSITAHRKKRDKKVNTSLLENLSGIGEKRRANLLKHFGGIKGVLNASIEELAKVSGISQNLAETIFKQLHKK